jgi:hypothetical protein
VLVGAAAALYRFVHALNPVEGAAGHHVAPSRFGVSDDDGGWAERQKARLVAKEEDYGKEQTGLGDPEGLGGLIRWSRPSG